MKNEAFSISSLMNTQSASAPAALKLTVSYVPIENILRNPENKIYIVGDVTKIKADIAVHGIRQPLEVIPAGEDDKYMLIGGERRLTSCLELYNEGDARFAKLPCIVKQSAGVLDDRIALITANATARELTDGERLDQYAALKAAMEAKKAAGELDGRVRTAIMDILGEGSGTVARMNAIISNCTEDVKQLVRNGACTITRAYGASQREGAAMQRHYAVYGYDAQPRFTDEERAEKQKQKEEAARRKETNQQTANFLLECYGWELIAEVPEVGIEYRKKQIDEDTILYAELDNKADLFEESSRFKVQSRQLPLYRSWHHTNEESFLGVVRQFWKGGE